MFFRWKGEKRLSTKIGWVEYLLVGIGVLLLPVYFIGLLLIGIAIYRIGDKMQKYKEETDEELDRKFGSETRFSEETLEEWK